MPNKIILNAYLETKKSPYWDTVDVANEDEAVQASLSGLAYAFNIVTYDMKYDIVQTTDGPQEKLVSLKVLDKTPTRWVGLPETFNIRQVAAKLNDVIQNFDPTAEDAHLTNLPCVVVKQRVYTEIADIFDQHSTSMDFIPDPTRCYHAPDEFIPLKAGEKVFNNNGQQIWPKP